MTTFVPAVMAIGPDTDGATHVMPVAENGVAGTIVPTGSTATMTNFIALHSNMTGSGRIIVSVTDGTLYAIPMLKNS